MQSNPFLTVLKIAAFAVLAFLVGVSSCQKANLEDKITKLDGTVGELPRAVDDLSRAVERGGTTRRSTGGAGGEGPTQPDLSHDRATLDAQADPSKPRGTPGRYKDYLSEDPDPEVLPASAGHDDSEMGEPYGPEPKGFNPVTENDGVLRDYIHQYCGDGPADRQ